MAYGFEIRNSAGAIVQDNTSIGLQIVHEVTLTAASTNVVFTSAFPPFHMMYFSMHPSDYAQSLLWSDVTPSGAPADTHTYNFVIKYGKTLGPVRLFIMGGDSYATSVDGTSGTGGAL